MKHAEGELPGGCRITVGDGEPLVVFPVSAVDQA